LKEHELDLLHAVGVESKGLGDDAVLLDEELYELWLFVRAPRVVKCVARPHWTRFFRVVLLQVNEHVRVVVDDVVVW
jgi:hypothetical protein